MKMTHRTASCLLAAAYLSAPLTALVVASSNSKPEGQKPAKTATKNGIAPWIKAETPATLVTPLSQARLPTLNTKE